MLSNFKVKVTDNNPKSNQLHNIISTFEWKITTSIHPTITINKVRNKKIVDIIEDPLNPIFLPKTEEIIKLNRGKNNISIYI